MAETDLRFEKWLRTVCFQQPTPEAYDLAREAWKAAAPQPAGEREGLTLAVDAAMVEMKNIHPPLRRSECERLILAALAAPAQVAPAPFQQRMDKWLLACFGETIARDKTERNHRFLEEALELVQALGCTASEAHQLVDYTFGREIGEPRQEVGGVMTTLAALCQAHGLDMEAAAEDELARIWTKVEQIRAKQAAKPKNSPLPAAAPAPQPMTLDQFFAEAKRIGLTADVFAAQLSQRPEFFDCLPTNADRPSDRAVYDGIAQRYFDGDTSVPKAECIGDIGECVHNGACMYACGLPALRPDASSAQILNLRKQSKVVDEIMGLVATLCEMWGHGDASEIGRATGKVEDAVGAALANAARGAT